MATTRIEVLKRIPLKDIIPTPDNPRHPQPDDPDVIELAKSIKASGLLQPVVVRHHPEQEGKFDLRCGARRFAAHQQLKAKTILSIVREMDDAEAAEATALENLQRENMSPLEEGQSIAMLLRYRPDAKAIASNIGRSVSWVYRRASLANLADVWRDEIDRDGSPIATWSAGHLELISRMDPVAQKKLFHDMEPAKRAHFATLTVSQLQDTLKLYFNDLDAPAAFLSMGPACDTCEFCSLAQPDLFNEDLTVTCFNPDCLEAKRERWLVGQLAAARTKHGGKLVLFSQSGYVSSKDILADIDPDDVLKCWEIDDEPNADDPDLRWGFCVDHNAQWDPLKRIVVLADRRNRNDQERSDRGGDEDGDGDGEGSEGSSTSQPSPEERRRNTLSAFYREVIEPMRYEDAQKSVKGFSLVSLLIGIVAIRINDYESDDWTGLVFEDEETTWPGDMQAMHKIYNALGGVEPVKIAQDKVIWKVLQRHLDADMNHWATARNLPECSALSWTLYQAGIITYEQFLNLTEDLGLSEEE